MDLVTSGKNYALHDKPQTDFQSLQFQDCYQD